MQKMLDEAISLLRDLLTQGLVEIDYKDLFRCRGCHAILGAEGALIHDGACMFLRIERFLFRYDTQSRGLIRDGKNDT